MKDSSPGANAAAQPVTPNRFTTISERKLKANLENAKKSTGPKTPRGKAFSRRNAVKHGLFVSYATDFEALDENPNEYRELLNGLWKQYRPVGWAEEIEVERIAVCCWRLKRAWRYENALNLDARRDFVRAELDYQEPYCKERDQEEKAVVLLLRDAKKEIEESGEISQDLKNRIVGLVPQFESLWALFNKVAQERLNEPRATRRFEKLTPQRQSWVLAMQTVATAIRQFEQFTHRRWTNVVETAVGRHAIPNREVLDRLLRYETTIDRALNRSLDRLERLQRRRRGEPVPPPLSVRLTQ